MTDRTEARLHEMMEASAAKVGHQPSDLEGKVGAFYKAFMDEPRIETLGGAPIASELSAISAAKDRDDIAATDGAFAMSTSKPRSSPSTSTSI